MKRLIPLLAVVLLSACGGGGTGMSAAPSAQPPNSTPVQVNLGDEPADRLLAATLTVNSVSLSMAGGAAVTVMSAPRPMEVMRLMGTVAPLAMANVPQGTYTGASITFGSAAVMHLDPTTGQVTQRQVAGPMTGNVTFSTPMVVGTAPMVLNLDIDMAMSVAIDASGNVAMTPVLTARTNAMNAAGLDPENGGMHGVTGVVGGMGGVQGQFSLSMMQGLSAIPMATGAGTQYAGMSGMGMMANGLMVTVDATLQPDGSWRASNVQWRMAGGAMASGVVLSLTGSPVSQAVLAMQDGVGTGMSASNLAGTTTANITDTTAFSIDSANVDLTGLPFAPAFGRASLSKGQRVEALSASQMAQGGGMSGMTGGAALTATSMRLVEQGLRGTVSSYAQSGSTATFVLTLAADSAFARLTGSNAIVVYQRAATQLRGATTLTNGSKVQVRGLLFNDSGAFRFVASRIVQ